MTAVGRGVAVEAAFGCMACARCRRGDYNLCARIAETGLGHAVDGGMSQWFRAPAERLVDLPPGLDLADASLVEPASVAWHGPRSGNVGPGTRVAVVGGGAIGLLAVAGAGAMGAPEVALDARHDAQIAAGERLGVTTTDDGLYDVVVEAAGSASALARAVDLAAPRGVRRAHRRPRVGIRAAVPAHAPQGGATGAGDRVRPPRARARHARGGPHARRRRRDRRRPRHPPLPLEEAPWASPPPTGRPARSRS